MLALAGGGCDQISFSAQFYTNGVGVSVVSMSADDEPLAPTDNGFLLSTRDLATGEPVTFSAIYAGGETSVLTIAPDEECNRHCTFTDCDPYGVLLGATVEYDVPAAGAQWRIEYFTCDWQHSSVQGGP